MAEETIEGRNPVIEALKTGVEIDKIYVSRAAEGAKIQTILRMAREKNIPISYADSKKIEAMSESGNCQGIVAALSGITYSDVSDILREAEKLGEKPFIVIADEITDTHNLGAIIRSAAASGAHGVIIPMHRSAGITAAVSKTSAGAVSHIKIAKVASVPKTIDALKKEGIWIYGTDIAGDRTIYEEDMSGACAIVVGSEDKGMGRLVKEKCDFLVRIPMKNNIESLNASVAAALVMFEVSRRRQI